ncbi:hypothetical protein [Paenibacillus sp.]|uniref:hypothetical protein n=1 Tax=Paenibacillus sp. TaxID=58172 RepID=UPI002D395C9D|nr:hypothetical protein [Paenibacillus sp.]HZG86867.1 hypothetical protein [Paenibacillus sp.]
MGFLFIVILIVGMAGMIGNQYAMLRKMDRLEAALRDIRDMKAEERREGNAENSLDNAEDSNKSM